MKISGKYIAVFLLVLLSIILIGCGVPQKDYDALKTQLAQAQNDYNSAESQLSSLQNEFDTTKAKLSADYNTVKSQLDAAQNQIKNLQGTIDSQSANLTQTQANITQLQNQLDAILDTELTQYYQVTYLGSRYEWDLSVALRSYFNYRGQTRPSELGTMATVDDATVVSLANKINDSSLRDNLKMSDVVNLIARFTQTLPRTNQDIETADDDYPRYPLETLVEQGGDSEDTSILAATLLSILDFDVVLLSFPDQKHVAVGVYMANAAGYSFEYKGKRYIYLETTGQNWSLGELPTQYMGLTPTIYPIG